MQIRASTDNDKVFIRQLHQSAFGASEGSTVSQLAIDLLEDKTALPILSLVAEKDNDIVGHVIFSSVTVAGTNVAGAYILAPLAVAVHSQGGGIGTALINQGLNILRARDAEFVLVLGDPNYYCRSGFKTGLHLKPPYALQYPEAWMALELTEGALLTITGTVQCAASLSSPELW
ncbi:MAG: N-acetyltransferase [Halopseudomonas sp.]